MKIFNSIKDKLFKSSATKAAAPAAAPTGTAAQANMAAKLQAATTAATATVDIAAVLDGIVKTKGIKSNWRESIVDLMKLLDLDSSLAARKTLAAELKYSGPHADGSAEKNIWLHKEVMKALAQNGGIVPKELLK